MPEAEGAEEPLLACWNRRGRLFVDATTLRRLRDGANQRWAELEAAEVLPPASSRMLVSLASFPGGIGAADPLAAHRIPVQGASGVHPS